MMPNERRWARGRRLPVGVTLDTERSAQAGHRSRTYVDGRCVVERRICSRCFTEQIRVMRGYISQELLQVCAPTRDPPVRTYEPGAANERGGFGCSPGALDPFRSARRTLTQKAIVYGLGRGGGRFINQFAGFRPRPTSDVDHHAPRPIGQIVHFGFKALAGEGSMRCLDWQHSCYRVWPGLIGPENIDPPGLPPTPES